MIALAQFADKTGILAAAEIVRENLFPRSSGLPDPMKHGLTVLALADDQHLLGEYLKATSGTVETSTFGTANKLQLAPGQFEKFLALTDEAPRHFRPEYPREIVEGLLFVAACTGDPLSKLTRDYEQFAEAARSQSKLMGTHEIVPLFQTAAALGLPLNGPEATSLTKVFLDLNKQYSREIPAGVARHLQTHLTTGAPIADLVALSNVIFFDSAITNACLADIATTLKITGNEVLSRFNQHRTQCGLSNEKFGWYDINAFTYCLLTGAEPARATKAFQDLGFKALAPIFEPDYQGISYCGVGLGSFLSRVPLEEIEKAAQQGSSLRVKEQSTEYNWKPPSGYTVNWDDRYRSVLASDTPAEKIIGMKAAARLANGRGEIEIFTGQFIPAAPDSVTPNRAVLRLVSPDRSEQLLLRYEDYCHFGPYRLAIEK